MFMELEARHMARTLEPQLHTYSKLPQFRILQCSASLDLQLMRKE